VLETPSRGQTLTLLDQVRDRTIVDSGSLSVVGDDAVEIGRHAR
jgi:hypothetical protein